MIDKSLIDLLLSGSPHAILIVAVIVLWNENRRLTAKVEDLSKQVIQMTQVMSSVHAVNLRQNETLSDIKRNTDPFEPIN